MYKLTQTIEFSDKPKVIFDTNAYRDFTNKYLTDSDNRIANIEKFKACEKKHSIIPSTNLLTLMELYQHMIPNDSKLIECNNSILFSFFRSFDEDGQFHHQPLHEIEISDKLFNAYLESDMVLVNQILEMHQKFCLNRISKDSKEFILFATNMGNELETYKSIASNSIIDNISRIYKSYNQETREFTKSDLILFKEKYAIGNEKKFESNGMRLYIELGISLFDAFKKRLNIQDIIQNENEIKKELIIDYMPALHSYVEMWKRFECSKPNSNNNFNINSDKNKRNLLDSYILFSIVPEKNIHFVTEEILIHKYFEEIGYADYVHKLEDYLKKIEFN